MYEDKPGVTSYERIGKWDEEKYKKGDRKPYFIEIFDTPRRINLYAVADEDADYNSEGVKKQLV